MAGKGPSARIDAEDVLDVFRTREDESEPLTAPEIADALGCSRRTALDRLHELADSGVVASKKVGGRSRVWWLPSGDASPSEPPADDPLFTGGALYASDDPVEEETIDDVLYGEPEG